MDHNVGPIHNFVGDSLLPSGEVVSWVRKHLALFAWLFVVGMGAFGLWSIQREGELREERVCGAFVVFTDALARESDNASPERVVAFKARLLDELRCG